jgi:hypothetical protein
MPMSKKLSAASVPTGDAQSPTAATIAAISDFPATDRPQPAIQTSTTVVGHKE